MIATHFRQSGSIDLEKTFARDSDIHASNLCSQFHFGRLNAIRFFNRNAQFFEASDEVDFLQEKSL